MPRKTTRREILAAGVSAAMAAPTLVNAQTPSTPAEAEFHVPERGKALYSDALKNGQNNTKERMKFSLRENSEPCFTYIPEEPGVTAR